MPSPLVVLGVVGCVCVGLFVYTELIAPAIEEMQRQREEEERMMYRAQTRARPQDNEMRAISTARDSGHPKDGSAIRQRRRSNPHPPLIDLMSAPQSTTEESPWKSPSWEVAPHDVDDFAHTTASSSGGLTSHSRRDDLERGPTRSTPIDNPQKQVSTTTPPQARAPSPAVSVIYSIDSEALTDLEELDGPSSVQSLSDTDAGSVEGQIDGENFSISEDGGSWSELAAESSEEEDHDQPRIVHHPLSRGFLRA